MAPLLRAVHFVALLALLAPAGRVAAQQASAPWVRLAEPDVETCRAARTPAERQKLLTCVVGRAFDPAGTARVTLNGEPARVRADSAGVSHFVGFVAAEAGETRIEVVLHPAAGAPLVERYAIVSGDPSQGGDGASYTLRSLTPRVLGGPSPAAVAGAGSPSARAVDENPAPAPIPAAERLASTDSAADARVAVADPGPAASTVPAAPAVSADSGEPAPDAGQLPAAAPAAFDSAAPPVGGGTPAQGVADAGPATRAESMPEDAQNYVSILEPREWSGVSTRGITVQPRNSVRVVGLARHAFGVARVEVNGVRAARTTEPDGQTRFVAFVAPDAATSQVEVVVRGFSGPPIVRHYAVEAAPAPAVLASSGAAPAATPAAAFRGRRWAVVVGISDYQDAGITGLRFADDDARAFYEFLRSPRAGGGGIPEENVRLLLNEGATYREIRSALFTFLKAATPEDQVFIYFAGHGAPDPQRLQNLYLLTHDTDVADISGTAFPMDDVTKAIRDLYARDILVVTDACHSAGVGGQVATRDLGFNQINESFLQQLNASTGGLAIFTASGANQLSSEDERWGGGHGVFTYHLIQGLNGAADEDGDRIVTVTEMMEYTRSRVRADTRNAQIPTISQTTYDPYWPVAIVSDDAALPAPERLAESAPAPEPSPAPAPEGTTADRTAAGPATEQEAAIERFREAVRLFPASALYRRQLALALRDAGRHLEAVPELQEAARLEPGNAEHVFELGQTFRAAAMRAEAAAELRSAIRLQDRSADYHNALGMTLLEDGNPSEAIDPLRRAVRLADGVGRLHRDLGMGYAALGRFPDAVEELTRATQLDPRVASHHAELAAALEQAGRSDEAVEAYREAARIEPSSAAHRHRLATALRGLGRNDEAMAELRAAAALEPENAALRHQLGRVLRDLGLPYEMLQELREAARLAPDLAEVRHDLGLALRGAGQLPEAVAELAAAVEKDPGIAAYHHALGLARKEAGDPQGALESLREAVAKSPDGARLRFDLGILLRDLGLLDEAVVELEAAVRLDGADREIRQALGETRRRVRDRR